MATTSAVTASVVVSFDAGDSADSSMIKVEIDTREGGKNDGKSSFSPGNEVFLLLYKTDNVVLNITHATAGTLVPEQKIPIEFDEPETLTFSGNSETANTNYPIVGALISSAWLGTALEADAAPTKENAITIRGGSTDKVVGVASVEYASEATVYRLHSVPEDITEVLIYFSATVEE